MKNLIFFVCAFGSLFSTVAQEISSYKYVIVPRQFEFLKEPNQYELNALAKFLFEKNGYVGLTEGESYPEELNADRCKALVANVKSNSGLFSTKLLVTLTDCNNREVFVSEEGSTRVKNFKVAFHEALRQAFESVPQKSDQAEVAVVAAQPTLNSIDIDTVEESIVVLRPEIDTVVKENPVKVEVVENLLEGNSERAHYKTATRSKIKFSRENATYYLEKTEKGFDFYQEGMGQPFAALIKSSTGNSFIYSAINSKGVAQFDAQGNLVVEILDNDTNTLNSIVYKLQD